MSYRKDKDKKKDHNIVWKKIKLILYHSPDFLFSLTITRDLVLFTLSDLLRIDLSNASGILENLGVSTLLSGRKKFFTANILNLKYCTEYKITIFFTVISCFIFIQIRTYELFWVKFKKIYFSFVYITHFVGHSLLITFNPTLINPFFKRTYPCFNDGNQNVFHTLKLKRNNYIKSNLLLFLITVTEVTSTVTKWMSQHYCSIKLLSICHYSRHVAGGPLMFPVGPYKGLCLLSLVDLGSLFEFKTRDWFARNSQYYRTKNCRKTSHSLQSQLRTEFSLTCIVSRDHRVASHRFCGELRLWAFSH